MNFAGD